MKPDSAWNMFVFRDGRETVPGASLARVLRDRLAELQHRSLVEAQDQGIEALLLAGELECALYDADSPEAADVARITDALAVGLRGTTADRQPHAPQPDCSVLLKWVPQQPPRDLKISPPEGFAYYALHPLDFADLAANVPLDSRYVGVIGIRSIGVTLSALVLAEVRSRGKQAVRFSVRPNGHPYDRQLEFSPQQAREVDLLVRRNADVLVVDEGPGMSGSSFLAVGDALVRAGVKRDRIAFLGSRVPDPDSLRAADGGSRWRSYRSYFARKNSRLPELAKIYVGGGDWRYRLLAEGSEWPASWTQMERLKFLSPDLSELYKFEGFGRFGREVHERAEELAKGGFGPTPLGFSQGFSIYPVIKGSPMRATDISNAVLETLAQYCAYRAREFRCHIGQNPVEMHTMVRFNLAEEFGCELNLEPDAFHSESPVLVDGRMLPHEWLRTGDGTLLKVDAASHCDDHFFPGPTDIAWDLAGTIVEWNMSPDAQSRFVELYRRKSGEDPSHRLPAFLLAYTVFRCGYCLMAAGAMRGSGEEMRLLQAHDQYRSLVEAFLPRSMAA